MPEKHRSAVDFSYNNGAFGPLSATDPVQLYRVFEREVTPAKSAVIEIPECMKCLLFCLSGEGTVSVNGETYAFAPSSLLCFPYTFEKMTLSSNSMPTQYMCIFFDTALRTDLADMAQLFAFFNTLDTVYYAQSAPKCAVAFSDFLAELCLMAPTMMLVKGLFYQTLITVYRQFSQGGVNTSSQTLPMNAVGQTVYAIIRYVDSHLLLIDNLTDMAKELGYSYNYLSHLFRRKTGMTIQAYVTRKKIERSTALLEDEQYSVTEIAAMLNYDCIQSFSKAFRRAMNMSPTEYRARFLAGSQ